MKTATADGRLDIINCMTGSDRNEMKQEVLNGLTAPQKYLPCKYFYDSRGSALFEQICLLPEYYQTRTELEILTYYAPAIMQGLSEGNLIELGSGANWKIRVLLDAANGSRPGIRYVPIDVCEQVLRTASTELLDLYPGLAVLGIVADFTKDMDLLLVEGAKLITFFGSTIGNFNEKESRVFLRNIAKLMGRGDRFLVGMDMIKSKDVLEAAYNDAEGVTAEFNKNILTVMNRELRATFDLSSFDHLAFYNGERECIEMHLRANRDVAATIADVDLHMTMERGETIFTEICRKFSTMKVKQMAAEAGLMITRWFSDPREWFSLVEMMPRDPR
jgi:L-histidine N-alpha-methyltransferase